MKKILFSAFMLSVLAFVSCSKSDDNSGSQDSGIYLPTKFNSTELNTTFQYNDQNQLIECKEFESNGSYTNTITFVYTNGQLTSAKSVVVEIGKTQTYSSTKDYIITYQNNDVTVNIAEISNGYTFNTSTVYKIDSNGNLESGDDYTLTYDSRGNLTRVNEDGGEYIYNYDDKNGVLKNVKTPQWVFYVIVNDFYYLKVNNLSKSNIKDSEDAEQMERNVYYEYNSANYPVKMTSVGSDEDTVVGTIEYIKK